MKSNELPEDSTDDVDLAQPVCTVVGEKFAPDKLVGEVRRRFRKYADGKEVK